MKLKTQSLVIKDFNHLNKLLTELEGGKKQVNIAQTADVMNKLALLASYNFRAVEKVLHKRAVEIKKARKKIKK